MPNSLLSSYLASGMRKSAFFPSDFGDASARVARTRSAATRKVAPELVAVLREQNGALPPSAARDANLDALANGAAAVVTGQQVGLFLGPLYTLYKAATAVVAARALAQESGVRCVPIFWLQTEDHDFAEIAGCSVGGAELRLPVDDARISVAHRCLDEQVSPLLATLAEALADQPHAAEVCALLSDAYRPGRTLAQAFARALGGFFDELLVLDPRDARLARLGWPVLKRAIDDAAEIERRLSARGDELRRAGFDEQVPPRPGFTLAFHHPEGPTGPRFRLAQNPPHLDANPLCYSTSALLRPLLQDSLLPTAAYVGGPAEVAYLAQVAPLYPLFGLEPPLVIPRARFRLIAAPARRLLDQLGLQPADAEDAELLTRLAPPPANGPERSWSAELESRLDQLLAQNSDENLRKDVTRARGSIRHALERLERRHLKAAVTRDHTLAERVRRLQAWLFPGGAPQERSEGVAWFAAHVGCAELRRAVCDAVEILHPIVKDIFL